MSDGDRNKFYNKKKFMTPTKVIKFHPSQLKLALWFFRMQVILVADCLKTHQTRRPIPTSSKIKPGVLRKLRF